MPGTERSQCYLTEDRSQNLKDQHRKVPRDALVQSKKFSPRWEKGNFPSIDQSINRGLSKSMCSWSWKSALCIVTRGHPCKFIEHTAKKQLIWNERTNCWSSKVKGGWLGTDCAGGVRAARMSHPFPCLVWRPEREWAIVGEGGEWQRDD